MTAYRVSPRDRTGTNKAELCRAQIETKRLTSGLGISCRNVRSVSLPVWDQYPGLLVSFPLHVCLCACLSVCVRVCVCVRTPIRKHARACQLFGDARNVNDRRHVDAMTSR